MIKTYFYSATQRKLLHDVDLSLNLIQHEDDLLWVDLYDFKDEKELSHLAKVFDFHYLAVEDCLQHSPRAKIDTYDKYYFFMLHALRYKEDSDEEITPEQLNVFLSSNYVVTVHRRNLPILGRLARECLTNITKHMENGSDMFLYHIFDGITDEYFPILDRIDQRVDELEDQLYEQPSKEITEEFLALKRTLLSMRRAIHPLKRMFTSMNGQFMFQVSKESEPYFLDLIDHIERIIDTIESLRDLLDGALETYYSIISARTNETIRILTLISTVFMPLTFITGFFGMNVPLPEQETVWATVAITAGLLVITVWMFLIFKMKKWI
ncbi:magnesium transporter [Desulfotomaculum arcticum]|uniref:Magnesium transport protein CorA n=1 Tax=Desulfotruncus arcticus DSM 17038 TaxID=1121424 RepID=A0A1I2XG30_9FIRM|nr:magnesium/cobalt transporter CorA [Desulfotruncus arcticus]SFH12443.1 magnesium transporter [Desulfotomaculum arcticum] [Desulfotruncus arcticus DSM 17038]